HVDGCVSHHIQPGYIGFSLQACFHGAFCKDAPETPGEIAAWILPSAEEQGAPLKLAATFEHNPFQHSIVPFQPGYAVLADHHPKPRKFSALTGSKPGVAIRN